MSKYLFMDLETTGFSREWDYIIEVAAVLYDTEEEKIIGKFHEYIKPGKKIPTKITEITGIDDFKVRDARSELDVLTDFIEWVFSCGADKIVGHNIKTFDNNFMLRRAEKYGIPMYDIELIDTLKIARDLTKKGTLNVPNHKQPTLAAFYNIEYQAHSAIEDVMALIQIYKKLTSDQQVKEQRKVLGF